jgi:hypothetical protein
VKTTFLFERCLGLFLKTIKGDKKGGKTQLALFISLAIMALKWYILMYFI